MKLLELLVKERIEWHPEALCYTQDKSGYCGPYKIINAKFQDNGLWSSKDMVVGASTTLCALADDWQTAIVTKEQYDNACKLIDDGYTLWFGGECPVNAHAVVAVQYNFTRTAGRAHFYDWKSENIKGYKVLRENAWSTDDMPKLKPDYIDCRCQFAGLNEVYKTVEIDLYPAHSFLEKGVQHMKDRAAQRDSAEGERSMAACVNAFNAMFGKDLTETQGWQFMVLLKMARSRNKFNPDDYEDGAAYTGLAGEAHSHE